MTNYNTTLAPQMHNITGQKCTNTIQTLSSLIGDYVPVFDSLKGGVLSASTTRGRKIVYSFEDNCFRVVFQSHPLADFFLAVAHDGRVKLTSPSNPTYGFYLVSNLNGLLQWVNENDPNHFVHWQNSAILPTFSSPDLLLAMPSYSEQGSELSSNLSLNSGVLSLSPRLVSIGLEENSSSEALYSQGPMLPIMEMEKSNSLQIPQGYPSIKKATSLQLPQSVPRIRRTHSTPLPSVSDSTSSKSQTHERDSKQNLVNLVEPKVDEMLSRYYASKDQYQKNQNGRMGPPVLRGEDVLFIPAKKKAALENVISLLKKLRDFGCTITSATKVCQKKKKRQLKGFLIYIQLASKEEVQAFLDGPYLSFEDTMQGVKKAIF